MTARGSHPLTKFGDGLSFRLLQLTNVVFVAFIYLNVLLPKWTILGVAVSKATLGVSLLLYLLFSSVPGQRRWLRRRPYIAWAFMGITGLAIIGVLKGSALEDVWTFVSPLLMLLAIPLIQLLSEHNGRDSYLRHIVVSTSILAVYVIYVYFARGSTTVSDGSLSFLDESGFTSTSFPGGAPRIIVTTAVFFPAALVAAYYLSVRGHAILYYLSILLFAAGIYIGQSLSIWLASGFAVICSVSFIRGSSVLKSAILWTLAALVALATVNSVISNGGVLDPGQVFDLKGDSIDQKQSQTAEALEVFKTAPFFGRGLGYRYQRSEIPSLSDSETVFIESSYAMLLGSTGLVGLVVYAFLYLYYPLVYLFGRVKDGPNSVVAISHVVVLIASIALPYFWSGGIGFFFIAFLGAWLDAPQARAASPQKARRAARRGWQLMRANEH